MIEAGADVDFLLVLRAIGPLDGIVQAVGCCNREGTLPSGLVIVFDPKEGGIPPGPYRIGMQDTKTLLQSSSIDLNDPSIYQRYFEQYYSHVNRDERHIQSARESFDYPLVAKDFRMIEDDTSPVIVHYPQAERSDAIDDLLEGISYVENSTR